MGTEPLDRRLWLVLGIAFSLLFVGLTIFHHPYFPVFTPYGVVLPYWLPLCGVLPVFFLLYAGRKTAAVLWLFLFFCPALLFNANLLRADVYFLILCLFTAILAKTREQFLFGLRMILAGMYIWTGIHKINPDFVELMPGFLQKRLFHEVVSNELLEWGVRLFPFAEIGVGVLCLLPFAKPRAVAGILLHVGILALLLLGGWNRSMLVWNLLLVLCHVFMWKDASRYSKNNLLRTSAPAVLALVLPALFFVGAWPVFASWTMYSARVESHYVDIPEEVALNPPAAVRDYLYSFEGTYYIGLTQWADSETGGAPCSEPWLKSMVFKQTQEYLKGHK